MGGDLILDTDFVIDLEREALAGLPGRAHAFLERNEATRLHITLVTSGELASGPRLSGRIAWDTLVQRFPVLAPDLGASWIWGQTFRYLKDQGMVIGANDLWIASIALSRGWPVVTRNATDFRRVPGLEVVDYGA